MIEKEDIEVTRVIDSIAERLSDSLLFTLAPYFRETVTFQMAEEDGSIICEKSQFGLRMLDKMRECIKDEFNKQE